MLRIGVDTGGTFTDFVVLEEGRVSVLKIPSTPQEPERALLEGITKILGAPREFLVQHGSTVATNALLERKGARTLLVTTLGLEDIIEIGRQNRPSLYSLSASRPEPLVPARHRVGVKERLTFDGSTLVPLEKKSLEWLKNKVAQLAPEAVAVSLLYSYQNPDHELRIAEALQETGLPISLSHVILPEFREYERTSATVINAYLTPRTAAYMKALSSNETLRGGRVTVMQSNGGTISPEAAVAEPIRTLFSGPAGGVLGSFEVAREAGYDKIITFDMGGTSTDVSLCDGSVTTTNESVINHFPVPIQMIAIHTVGAGGGSIAWVDSGGLLRVGPQSAGADPGPACYGKGDQVTVTDANLALGLLDPDWFLGGEFVLSPPKVRPAFEKLIQELEAATSRSWETLEVAEGIRSIVNAQMESAIRVISLERGYDTRDFTLVSFGGAAGLHACDLARALMIPRVLIPQAPGLLSAQGILRADISKDRSRTVLIDPQEAEAETKISEAYAQLTELVTQDLESEGFGPQEVQLERSADCRYAGQSYELNVPFGSEFLEAFHDKHKQYYGFSNPGLPVEIVTLRLRGIGRLQCPPLESYPLSDSESPLAAMIQEKQIRVGGQTLATPFYMRSKLEPGNRAQGPAVILEYSSTILVPPGFEFRVDAWKNILIEPVQPA